MFLHYKGPQDSPRTDKYLFGAPPLTEIHPGDLMIILIQAQHS